MLIDGLKVATPEESPVGRERAGVRRAKDSMSGRIDHRGLLARSTPPQHKHQTFLSLVQNLNHAIGEPLPALTPVTVGLVGPYGEHCVEQKHTLFCPRRQFTMTRQRNSESFIQFLEDVLERRWWTHSASNRKTEAMSLIRTVVRILTKHHNPDPIKRGVVEGIEYVCTGWKDPMARLFLNQKGAKVGHIRVVKLLSQLSQPRRFKLDRPLFTHGRGITRSILGLLEDSQCKSKD